MAQPRRPRAADRADRGRPADRRRRPARTSKRVSPRSPTSSASRSTTTARRTGRSRPSGSSSAAPAPRFPGSSPGWRTVLGLPDQRRPPERARGLRPRRRRQADPTPAAWRWSSSDAPDQPHPARGTPRLPGAAAERARSPTSSSAPWSLVLVGVTALVLTGNKISDSKAKSPASTSEDATAKPRKPKSSPPTSASRRPANSGSRRSEPRRQPLRLGAGDARTRADPPVRRLAGRTHRQRLRRRQIEGSGGGSLRGSIAGPGARTRRLRDRAGRGRRVRQGAEGHRRRHPGRARILRTRRRGRTDERRGHQRRRLHREHDRLPDPKSFIAKFKITVAFDAAPVADVEGEGRGAGDAARRRPKGVRLRLDRRFNSSSTTETTSTESTGAGE